MGLLQEWSCFHPGGFLWSHKVTAWPRIYHSCRQLLKVLTHDAVIIRVICCILSYEEEEIAVLLSYAFSKYFLWWVACKFGKRRKRIYF